MTRLTHFFRNGVVQERCGAKDGGLWDREGFGYRAGRLYCRLVDPLPTVP